MFFGRIVRESSGQSACQSRDADPDPVGRLVPNVLSAKHLILAVGEEKGGSGRGFRGFGAKKVSRY